MENRGHCFEGARGKIERRSSVKIAMLGHKRIPSREGGVEVVVEELSTRLVKLGHEVTCFNRGGQAVNGTEFQSKSEYEGVRLKEVFTLDLKGLAAVTSSFFACLQAGLGDFDVVHVHAEGPAFFSFLPKLFGKKVIVTVHGLDWARAKWGKFASWYIKRGEKHAVAYADEIIVLSASMKAYFARTYGREVRYIPNGVARAEKQQAELLPSLGLAPEEYILYLGRLVPEKGVHYLIEAYKQIKTTKKLVIAGGGSNSQDYVEYLKQLAQEDDRVSFTGFVQGRLLEELYSNAYVYCLPSDLEGMPLSLLEALSYGACCLTSDIPECAEVVQEHGLTFRKGDVQDLQQQLALLCDEAELVQKYRSEAADFVLQHHSWDKVVQETLTLYEKSRKISS